MADLIGQRRVRLVDMTAHAAGDERDFPTGQQEDAVVLPAQDINPLQRLIRQRLRERQLTMADYLEALRARVYAYVRNITEIHPDRVSKHEDDELP